MNLRRFLAVGMTFVAVMGCSSEPFYLRQGHKVRLINGIRHALLQSVEAEKSAVLATTDEESHEMARQSQRAGADADRLIGELRDLISADELPKEVEQLRTFEAAWAELQKVDERLLELAVANTNLKAARAAAGEGAAALDRLATFIERAQDATDDPGMVRKLSRASVAALRVHSLLLIHIPSSEDAEMTRLEQRIQALDDEVVRILAATRENAGVPSEERAAAAESWGDYQRVKAEVLRLSRENTNVISFDVSVHEKRYATEACLSALSALQSAIDSNPDATR